MELSEHGRVTAPEADRQRRADPIRMIRLVGITRTFPVGGQPVHALRDIHLTFQGGEHTAIMGPSGSGKSTLLNIMGLLDRPNAGTYQLDGVETTILGEERRALLRREQIGFVFQSFHLVPRLSASENVELPLVLAGTPPRERRERVASILQVLGLSDRAHHRPDQLSGGQRQRVAIARATVMEPRLILADEPTGNLDRASGQDVLRTLESLNARGLTLLVVTHDPQIGGRARRRIRMEDGAIVEDSA
jgi:putative ABC transport system ATP-binding protein